MENYTDFIHYLASKKSVDDRALNQQVWDRLAVELDTHDPVNILEIGGGIGTMIERLLERNVLQHANYTLLDEQPGNIAEAQRRLPEWAKEHGFSMNWQKSNLVLSKDKRNIQVTFLAKDLFDFLAEREFTREYDLLIAHAFLDLVDIPATLPRLFELIHSDGLFYFTINFDGETIFEPSIPDDVEIMRRYHRTMDARVIDGKPSGDSRTGRHLFSQLKEAGGEILAAGSSDWVVFAGQNDYLNDEAYFLRFIINTVQSALRRDAETDQDLLDAWASTRHAQVTSGTLVYIAHQLDFFGRVA